MLSAVIVVESGFGLGVGLGVVVGLGVKVGRGSGLDAVPVHPSRINTMNSVPDKIKDEAFMQVY